MYPPFHSTPIIARFLLKIYGHICRSTQRSLSAVTTFHSRYISTHDEAACIGLACISPIAEVIL